MKLLLTGFIVLFSLSSQGAKYHFSTISGDDNRTSLQATNPNTPWRTLSKLNSIFSGLINGDSILFKRGETFYGFITISHSNIHFNTYGTGELPIITSLVNLSGWTLYSANIWVSAVNSSLGSTVTQVLRNDAQLRVARYPNATATNKGYLVFENSTITSIQDIGLPLTPNRVGTDILVRKSHYENEIRRVASQSGTGVLTVTASFSSTPLKGMGYFFQNALSLVDEDGEYYYDASTKRIYMYSTTAPTGIQASTLSTLLTSTNFSNVSITNLYFKGANDTAIKIGVPNPGNGGSGFTIQNCTINFSQMGIYSSRHTNMNIYSNSLSDNLGAGIYIANGDNVDIQNNYTNRTAQIVGMDSPGGTGTGIYVRGSDAIIKYNSVNYTGYSAIRIDGDDIDCQYNYVFHYCNRKNDGGGIYFIPGTTDPGGRTNWKIRNNIVLYGDGAVEGSLGTNLQTAAIYMDASGGLPSAAHGLVQGNTGAYSEWGLLLHRANDIIATDNTFYGSNWQLYINSDNTTQLTRNLTIRRNIFFAKALSQNTAWFSTINGDINLFGAIDSNYYCKPIREPQGIANAGTNATGGTIKATRGTTGWYSLDKWKAYQPAYDQGSKISPKGFDTIRFEANTSYRDSVVILNYGNRDYTWLTATGVRVKGTLTLAPYSSVVLIRDTIVPVTVTPNVPPTVSLTSPANGSSYVAPATVNISATANDSDGSITKVDFYNGSTKLGTDNTSPYTLTLINVPAGGYSFTARTFDDDADSTTSAPRSATVTDPPAPNIAPTVSITSPANGATTTAPGSISIAATAGDQDGSITKVEFFNGAVLLSTDFTFPYTFNWTGVAAGNYNLTAKATDDDGAVTTSGIVSVTVQTTPPANEPPTVTLTSPANNAIYGDPGTVELSADGGDTDGSITQVEFYNGATLLGVDVDSPYVFTWLPVPAGNYNLTAKATDNSGATTTSSVASITVVANVPPTVSITSPADNSNFTTPAIITIDADAGDVDGNVTVLDFYVDDVYVGSDSTAPYTFDASGYTTGTYIISAKATDNSGSVTSSGVITVSVNPAAPLAINIEVAPILCNGGTTTITTGATGGTAPYSGTGSSVVGPGTYTRIVIDDDGTQDTAIITIVNPLIISLTDSLGTIANYAGSTLAVVYATGGTGSYQWQINGGAWQNSGTFAVPAGNYVVNVKDANNCTSSISFSIPQPTSTGPLNMQIKRVGEHINVNR